MDNQNMTDEQDQALGTVAVVIAVIAAILFAIL